tara:strand:- start:2634 stop:4358 length:1725 start_codon:yes stop_codon:yes gene_type:complete
MINTLFCSKETSIPDLLEIFENSVSNDLPSGIAIVVNKNNSVIGTITDGDIRRYLIKNNNLDAIAEDLMENNPILFSAEKNLSEIAKLIPIELLKRGRRSNKVLSKIILVNKKNQPIRILNYHEIWEQRVATHRHIVILGLGYVGLTMASIIADSGFIVTGFDTDKKKIKLLNQNKNYIHEKGLSELIKKNLNKSFFVTNELPVNGDVYVVSVGTPLNKNKKPDMSYLKSACTMIGKVLKRGNLVILRSTVPIGTTGGFVKELLEQKSNLKCGIDFYLSFAPERTAEGKALIELRNLPQIIGGYNKDSLEATVAIFRDITNKIVRVDTLESAEMAKLINNSFRDYIFAYSNQIAVIGSKYNIDVVKVIKAANDGYTRDPVPLPSPGVGGPCLTKDPYIFASSSSKIKLKDKIFKTGRKINEGMHHFIFNCIENELKRIGKNDSKKLNVFICGLAFKGNPETGDLRNSSSIEIIKIFENMNFNISGYDPVASIADIKSFGILYNNISDGFRNADVVIFLNNHISFSNLKIAKLISHMKELPIIFDGWSLFDYNKILNIRPCTYMGLSFSKSSIKQ